MSTFVTMTEMRVCVDPGIRGCGAAIFLGGSLLKAAYVPAGPDGDGVVGRAVQSARAVVVWIGQQNLDWGPSWNGYPIRLVIEWPQVYRAGRGRGDPNDLLGLAAVDGALAAICLDYKVVTYLPREWKGQVPKDVMVERIKSRLTPEELTRVELPAKSLQHNVYDAIGLGLKDLGRL